MNPSSSSSSCSEFNKQNKKRKDPPQGQESDAPVPVQNEHPLDTFLHHIHMRFQDISGASGKEIVSLIAECDPSLSMLTCIEIKTEFLKRQAAVIASVIANKKQKIPDGELMENFAREFAELKLESLPLPPVPSEDQQENDEQAPSQEEKQQLDKQAAPSRMQNDMDVDDKKNPIPDQLINQQGSSYALKAMFQSPRTDVIFGRESYSRLLQMLITEVMNRRSVNDRNCRLLVTGTPGVGKSAFAWVVLKYYLHSDQFNTIIVDFILFQVMYKRGAKDQAWVATAFEEKTVPTEVHQPSTLLLYDCRKEYPSPPIRNAITIAFSSPNPEHYSGFIKENCKVYLLPLWDLDELLFFGKSMLEEDTIRLNFQHAGGVARSVFFYDPVEVKRVVDKSIGNQTRLEFVTNLCGSQIMGAKFEPTTHKLLHFVVDEDLRDFQVAFASPYVCEEFLRKLEDKQEDNCRKWLHDRKDPIYASIRGQIFKAYVLRLLAAGGSFKLKCLEEEQQHPAAGPFRTVKQPDGAYSEVKLALIPTQKFGKLSEAKTDHLNIPTAKNRAAIDALFSLDTLIQITVSLDHGLKHKYVQEILRQFGLYSPPIVFIVPEDKYEAFCKQNYTTEKGTKHQKLGKVGNCVQFAMCIPLSAQPPAQ